MALLTEKDRQYKTPEDICAHVGDEYAEYHGAIVPPIFQNSLFLKPTESNGIGQGGHFYTRVSNPTIDIAERKIAALEGADGALCFSSGMGAMSAAALYFIKANCHVVMVGTAYGPMRGFICRYLAEKFGVTYTLVEGGVEEIEAAIRPETTLIYLESPSSCVFAMQDIEAIAKIAKARGIGTVIDGTYATPIHQQPLKYGIDIVCHTASKYMGGHSDIVAGVLAARKEIIESMQRNERELIGSCMDPHQAWLMIRGIRTMPVRLKQHGKSGKKVAAWLEKHEKPFWLRYVLVPGYSDSEADIRALGEHLGGFKMVERVEVLPYHTLGVHKYEVMGQEYKLKGVKENTPEQLDEARKLFEQYFKTVFVN